MRVGIDLDGVLYNFQDSFVRFLEEAGLDQKYNVKKKYDTWNFFEAWGMTPAEFVEICHEGVEAGIIFAGPSRKRAGSAIRRIKKAGHTIHIITDRPFGKKITSQETTLKWLDDHEIPYDSITFSADKTIVPTDYFVEDKLENYDALDAAGTKVYLINRPWNKRDDDRRRINSITDFANLLT